jgi:superoxide reductase
MRGIAAQLAIFVLVLSVLCAGGAAAGDVTEIYQTDQWATEKHVPVIDCPDTFVAGEMTEVTVEVGKEIEHPNTTEHHIRWIRLYFLPEGSPFAYEIGSFEFAAHGESVGGPNTSTIYTNHKLTTEFRTEVPGTLYATAFCNIHGLWESSKAISVGS